LDILLDGAFFNCDWLELQYADGSLAGHGCSYALTESGYHDMTHIGGGLLSVAVYGFTTDDAPDERRGYAYLTGENLESPSEPYFNIDFNLDIIIAILIILCTCNSCTFIVYRNDCNSNALNLTWHLILII